MSFKTRLLLVALVLAAVWGYRAATRTGPVAATDKTAESEAAAAPVRRFGRLAFTPCTLAPEFGTQTIEAQCARLRVPENRAAPNGRQIDLAIAWVPARSDAEPDPVFMLAGGPGQSALESFPGIAAAFEPARKNRDIILVDQRGTGGSNALICRDKQGHGAAVDDEAEDDPGQSRAFAERCLRSLATRADVRFYTTTDAIQDLDDVRRAIGADRINLMGVSYGTRVAQQYAKRYPEHTRTLTLDGVVPNSLVLGADFAKNLESSLDRQFARCAQDKTCAARLGNPRERLNVLLATLKATPPTVRYRDAITGESKEDKLTPGHVAMLARMFAYAPQAAALLPLEINEATHGRYETLMALAHLLSGTIGGQIMQGMQLSVTCTEDAAELRADPADADSLLGNTLVSALQSQCAAWPHHARPAGFREPLTGPVPTLLLSGEFDPVTPPRYGDEVAARLANARHLVVRGQGHNVLPVGCMPRLFAQFLDGADGRALDAACLAKVPYAPPFTGFHGWEP